MAPLPNGLTPELEAEYQESLRKIDALCANKEVMETISGRLPNSGEEDDEESYMQNIKDTLNAWAQYPRKTWRL
ncbi:MAG: hypothetical protein HDR50_06855 [Desulfovibrio sp.]|uniref:hypothetical protein n=1 Tax=Desulfovibrio sp. TaxID=885 RepID=UPI001A6DA89E|nr:hypothetical protein [Desulfovibrio sp.]MBD5417367.1 hypothetical protein [Desulfovibrio sp.]